MKRLRRGLWLLAATLLVVVVFQAFVGGVYPVGSSSMAPTLRPGDHVLVLYDTSVPERGEVVVVQGVGPDPLVKRVVALPNEELAITSDGDLLVDRAYLPLDPRALPQVLILDTDRTGFDPHFSWPGAEGGADSMEVVLDGQAEDPRDPEAVLVLKNGVHDGYLEASGQVRFGQCAVGDARVSVHLNFLGEQGRAVLRLSDQGDIFEVELDLQGGSPSAGSLRRVTIKGDQQEFHESEAFEWAMPEGALCLTLANFDNRVALLIDSQQVAHFEYSKTSRQQVDAGAPRFSIGVSGAPLRVGRLRIWRDLHYTSRGRFAVDHAVRLEPDELFLLGDNSDHSTDSREYGSVKIERMIGRAAWIVWPPSRFGRVSGPGEGLEDGCQH